MKAKWTKQLPTYTLGDPLRAEVWPWGASWRWNAVFCDLADESYGMAATDEEAMSSAEAAIRAHARRLLEMVGEEA